MTGQIHSRNEIVCAHAIYKVCVLQVAYDWVWANYAQFEVELQPANPALSLATLIPSQTCCRCCSLDHQVVAPEH